MNKILIFILLSFQIYCYPVNKIKNDIEILFTFAEPTYEITIDKKIYQVDLKRLLWLTSGMESNFGKDKYSGRIAKTYMQLEPESAKYYIKIFKPTKIHVESNINRKLTTYYDKDAMYVSYILYLSKLHYHKNWIDRYKYIYYNTNDIEWFIYKLYYNSIKGKSKFTMWKYREKYYHELILGGKEYK